MLSHGLPFLLVQEGQDVLTQDPINPKKIAHWMRKLLSDAGYPTDANVVVAAGRFVQV